MKKENINLSGIKINDSITMSVKHKRRNLRELESLFIALCGYSGIIMFFLNTFTFSYDSQTVLIFSVIFALLYGTASAVKGKAVWIFPVTFAFMGFGAFKYYSQIKNGFCLVFNIMYKKLTDTGINYFKAINPVHAEHNITVFFIFAVWILSVVIFFFTVYRPNILIVISVTFPIIEICLYYGIEVPVIWTALTIGYWFALSSICTSDLGEYFGGGGGFTRKDDFFFPKRKMKFKVTEKCGIWLIAMSMITAVITNTVIDVTGYERTDKIKEQRRELKTAINSFSMEDFASSISAVTESLGFSFEYQDNRLGKFSKITYKGKTDLIITLDDAPANALYLKGFTASEYGNNEWLEPENPEYTEINKMFEKYDIYPQQTAYSTDTFLNEKCYKIKISPQKKGHKYYTPYAIIPDESFSFADDKSISRKREKSYSFEFFSPDIKNLVSSLSVADIKIDLDYYDSFTDEQNQTIKDFSEKYNMNMKLSNRSNLPVLTNYNYMINMLVENQYRKFVYENYLSYPDNDEFKEIYNEYSDILENCSVSTSQDKLETLQKIKDKINSDVEYTLEPGKTPSTRDFTNYFLLENKKGYCVHYATAGVMLARMSGIPARYVTGYVSVGDDYNEDNKNPDGSYTVKLPDSRSHAWAEIYLDGYGWIPFEFTAGYSDLTIDSEHPENVTTATTATTESTITTTISPSSSPKQSHTTKSSESISSAITSAVTTTEKISESSLVSGTGSATHIKENIPDSVRKIFILIFAFLLIFARRWIIISIRNRKLNSGSAKKRVINNYRYVIRLLKYLGLKQDNLQHNEFSDIVEEKLSGEYFSEGCFSSFIKITMKSAFGNSQPTSQELDFLSAFSKELSKNICRKSNIFKKIYLKLISILV